MSIRSAILSVFSTSRTGWVVEKSPYVLSNLQQKSVGLEWLEMALLLSECALL